MSLDPQSGAPSPAPDADPAAAREGSADERAELRLVPLVRSRGGALLDALEAHYPGSREQAEAASTYAFAVAVELGLSRGAAELTREAAKLHDVGRVYVPAEILAKAAWSRTREEAAEVELHHEKGAQLALGAGIPERVCEWIRMGAERYDGGGPNGVRGEAIPLQARISRAAYATYAALTAGGAERGPDGRDRRPADALRASAGRELDPRVVDALARVLEHAA
jgi:HD-GYP domain-containing protein (c-di-GMP phosphodiesterase class II)